MIETFNFCVFIYHLLFLHIIRILSLYLHQYLRCLSKFTNFTLIISSIFDIQWIEHLSKFVYCVIIIVTYILICLRHLIVNVNPIILLKVKILWLNMSLLWIDVVITSASLWLERILILLKQRLMCYHILIHLIINKLIFHIFKTNQN